MDSSSFSSPVGDPEEQDYPESGNKSTADEQLNDNSNQRVDSEQNDSSLRLASEPEDDASRKADYGSNDDLNRIDATVSRNESQKSSDVALLDLGDNMVAYQNDPEEHGAPEEHGDPEETGSMAAANGTSQHTESQEDMPSKYDVTKNGKESNFVNPAYTGTQDDINGKMSNGRDSPPPRYEEAVVGVSATGTEVTSNTDVQLTEKKKEKDEVKMVGVGATFRFSTCTDRLLMALGTLSACLHGAALPCMIIIFGSMTDSFISTGAYDNFIKEFLPIWVERCQNLTGTTCNNLTEQYFHQDPAPPARLTDRCVVLLNPPGCDILSSTNPNDEIKNLMEDMKGFTVYYVIIGCAVLLVGYLQVMCWQTAAYNQTHRIRSKLFWAILRQEIGWFDTHEIGELNTRLSDDVDKIEGGIGEKLALFFQWISAFVAGIIIGFVYSWKLTLVILAVSPLLAMCGMAMGKLGSAMTSKELAAYAKAGAVAEEVFGAIRTVVAFGGEGKECNRYNNNLIEARDFGIKKGTINGTSMGLIFFVMFGCYSLAFWYGSKLVFDEELTPGRLMIVFFCVLIGAFSLGNAAPNIQDFAGARGAAFAVYGIIDNKPAIDSASGDGRQEENINGNLEFRNVHFNYPSRPDVKVLQGLSLKVQVGQTVALVGSSGCGKSTTVQLIQRFYDPAVGEVTMDGTDIREFNIKWLRQRIGVVSQEPVLFATTIAENIRYGQDGVTMDDIVNACKEANAHNFITKLPKQYDTLVGERGAQLSGGQKQRIAIARALVRNPKILLLDEATSALDTESEATVQAALDTARMGRTTLVIAHRLSTIRTADVIIGVKDGQVVEQGSHEELMEHKGLYYELVMNQQMDDEDVDLDEVTENKPDLTRAISARSSGKLKRGMSTVSAASGTQKAGLSTEDEEDEKLPDPELKRIMRLNAPEWPLIVIGCICAIIVGGVQPAFAIIFSDILGIYAERGDHVQDKVNLYAGMFTVIGVVAALGMLGMSLCFSRSGEFLTLRLRQLSFQAVLRQEIAYFDDHKNNVGALCTRLATDASAVQGATGSRLATFCQSMSSIGAGIIIGFIYSWKMTLLILGFVPFMLLSGFIQMKVLSGNQMDKKKALEVAGKVAIEAVENIRTVATLTKEKKFHDDYMKETTIPHEGNKKKAHIQGIAYAFSQAILFFAYAAAFALGAYLVEQREITFDAMFKVFSAIVFGAISAGQASSFAPDYGKAKISAAKVMALLDRKPAIDSSSPDGKTLSDCRGALELKAVEFNYPTRPDVTVLKGLDLSVAPGNTVALVGSSGCGKSTTVQLLERFYDPLNGEVAVEGQDIKDLNVQWLRSQMGIVSQEPILFDCSIRDNIAYGDNSRDVTVQEIIEAAKAANIHNFIETLPDGYNTNVGDKGAQLSGGQKQRVAIARALIRNPKILLLDEATSALDTESEKVVQAALDRAQEGRTCIVIAHRLSTVQNADCIVVIHHGKVVEMGTHSELLQQRGRYYKLNNAQLKK